MMRKIALLTSVVFMAAGMCFAAVGKGQVMVKKSDGTYVVNTTTLAPSVCGFRGATPLEVSIRNNKVVGVKALPNSETPKYFSLVNTKLLPKFVGLRLNKVAAVDGVSGATFSSKAVKANVEAAVKYYKTHR